MPAETYHQLQGLSHSCQQCVVLADAGTPLVGELSLVVPLPRSGFLESRRETGGEEGTLWGSPCFFVL